MLRAAVLVLGVVALQAVPHSAGEVALRAPRNFKQLPPIVQETLVAEGCRIPEAGFSNNTTSNVIEGTFAAPGQSDWAVLCAKGKRVVIRVFWGGPIAPCPARLENRDFEHAMVRDGVPWFSRMLSVASPTRIREAHGRHGAYEGTLPARLTHDGIEDGIEKGSSILYCHNGAWVKLAGAD